METIAVVTANIVALVALGMALVNRKRLHRVEHTLSVHTAHLYDLREPGFTAEAAEVRGETLTLTLTKDDLADLQRTRQAFWSDVWWAHTVPVMSRDDTTEAEGE